jgi:hypothetical protein
VVPKEYIPAVDKGIREQLENGVLAGYPMVDVKVTLYDGSYHDVDSSEMAFKIAASMGFKEGAKKAKPVLTAKEKKEIARLNRKAAAASKKAGDGSPLHAMQAALAKAAANAAKQKAAA